ncbi:MAG: hypothetical protein ACXADA_14785 [Candidatus Hodarchaeales archaeon]
MSKFVQVIFIKTSTVTSSVSSLLEESSEPLLNLSVLFLSQIVGAAVEWNNGLNER